MTSTVSAAVLAAMLFPAPAQQWQGSATSTPLAIDYTYLTTLPSRWSSSSTHTTTFSAFVPAQQAAMDALIERVSQVANVTFTKVPQVDDGETGQGKIAMGNITNPNATGSAYSPSYTSASGVYGDIWMSKSRGGWNNPIVGTRQHYAHAHELMHTLGLKHTTSGTSDPAPFLPASENSLKYTILSYKLHPGMASSYPRGPQLYDIAALQHLYGANAAFHDGDDTYSFNSVVNYIDTIWDGGGIDTIEVVDENPAVVNLNDGQFSSIGRVGTNQASNNIAIAYGATIENATCGSGNDTIIGNDADNVLTGGDGDDQMEGRGGNDTIDGGGGTDKLVYAGFSTQATVTVSGGVHTVATATEGTDTVTNVEFVDFEDGIFAIDDLLAPTPPPAPVYNVIRGTDTGIDSLYTTNDPGLIDVVNSMKGHDLIYFVNDTYKDIFYYGLANGGDRIYGFHVGEDLLDLTAQGVFGWPATGWVISEQSGSTYITKGTTLKIVLDGVPNSALPANRSDLFVRSTTIYE